LLLLLLQLRLLVSARAPRRTQLSKCITWRYNITRGARVVAERFKARGRQSKFDFKQFIVDWPDLTSSKKKKKTWCRSVAIHSSHNKVSVCFCLFVVYLPTKCLYKRDNMHYTMLVYSLKPMRYDKITKILHKFFIFKFYSINEMFKIIIVINK